MLRTEHRITSVEYRPHQAVTDPWRLSPYELWKRQVEAEARHRLRRGITGIGARKRATHGV
jgi:hypothetical protein